MTKKEAIAYFKECHLPYLKELEHGYKDTVRRSEAWSDYTDNLCKVGLITTSQYNRWSTPSFC